MEIVRITIMAERMRSLLNIMVTFLSTVLVIGLGAADIVAIIASGLAILFWLPRIKREISLNYGNSIWRYIRQLLSRNAKYDKD